MGNSPKHATRHSPLTLQGDERFPDAETERPPNGVKTRGRRRDAVQSKSPENENIIGYGRPPKRSQFKPGQSGNPKGRAKKSRNLTTLLQEFLIADIVIREGGRARRMSRMEALVRTLYARSFKGDAKSTSSLMALVKHCGLGAPDHATSEDFLVTEDFKRIADDFLARNRPTSSISRKDASLTVENGQDPK